MEKLLMETDPMILYFIGIVLMFIFVFSILKKAIRLAMFAGIFALTIMLIGPKANELQQDYNVKYNQGIVEITVAGKMHEFEAEDLRDVRVEERENGDSYVVYQGNGEEKLIKIPGFMAEMTKHKLKSLSLKM